MDEEKSLMLTEKNAEEGAATTPQVTVYNPGAKAPLSRSQFWRVLLSLELGMLAIATDIYSIPVAVPSLSSNVVGYTNSAWLGTAFLVSFSLSLLIWPRLCRGFGYKFSFVVAINVFTNAASHAASSKTAERMIAMRVVTGAGAGGVYGLFDVILRDIVPPKEVEKYMSVSRVIWAVTAVASPLMAGALVDYNVGSLCLDLFFLPGFICSIMALFFLNLPEPSWAKTWLNFRQFDYLGTLCLTAGTVCMLLVTASGGTLLPWISNHLVTLSISGLALLTGFFFIETLVPDPLLHPSLFRDRGLLIISIAAFFSGANLFGTMYYVPHFFQLVLEDSAMMSSISTLPMPLAMGMGISATMFVTSRTRAIVNTAIIGAILVTLASCLMIDWSSSTRPWETVVVLAILGLGQGTAMIGLLRTAEASSSHLDGGNISRLLIFAQASGHTFGVASFGALYMHKLQFSLGALVPDIEQTLADMGNLDDAYAADMRVHIQNAYESSMQAGWWLMFVCALIVLSLSFLVYRSQVRNETESPSLDECEKVSEAEKDFLID